MSRRRTHKRGKTYRIKRGKATRYRFKKGYVKHRGKKYRQRIGFRKRKAVTTSFFR